jgi:osmoprotectant transport system substrate-binding protein
MTAPLRRTLAVLTGTALAAVVAGCGLQNANGYIAPAEPGSIKHYDSLDGVEITVGAKDFTEQLILGNMLATVLQTAGADVTNRTNIAGSNGVRNALLNRTVDISPEYTGTGWISYLGHDKPIKGEEAQWKAVPPEDLTFCVEDEFYSRDDGFPSMLKAYDLTVPDSNVLRLDTGVVYDATAKGRCTFGEVFTTDGRIPALDLTVLEDDKEFFPLYNLTEVVQEDLLDAHPELEEIFAQINPKITNEVMLELNAKVDVDGQEPSLVAKEWLQSEGFVS